MENTLHITNEATLAKFIYAVDGLHDALLHEAVILHPGYVRKNGEMVGDSEAPNAQLVFQSQSSNIHAIQVSMKRVSRFRFESRREFQLEGEIKEGEIVLYLAGKEDSALSEIRAGEVEYTIFGSEFRGPEYKLIRAKQ